MKRILFILTVLLTCTGSISAQSIDEKKSDSKTIAFRDRSGSLMKEEIFNVGKFNRVNYDVMIYTDLIKNEKVGSLRVTTSDSRYLYYGYLDSDEIDATLKTLSYIKDNVLSTVPSTDTKIEYNSRDKVRIGVSAEANGKWVVYIYAHSYDKDTRTTFSSNDLAKMIDAITQAQTMITNKLTKK